MPRATVTARQLKNKDTGLDLVVTSYKETKGIVTSTVYYQVVLVSNLACFKTPNHKESDVVQYSIEKKMSEFEELRNKMSESFTGIVLPPISKKSLIVNDAVLKERRNSLDHLLKFFASVERLATCPALLEFLGVDAVRAKTFSRGESLEGSGQPVDSGLEEEKDEGDNPLEDVFEENLDAQPDSDLFAGIEEQEGDDDLFATDQSQPSKKVSMFEEQDMKPDLTEEDEKSLGLSPDIIITKKEKIRVGEDDEQDQSDLFEIEDDLDKLMTVDVGKHKTQKTNDDSSRSSASAPTENKAAEAQVKPALPTKPKAPVKPSIAPKPKHKDTDQPSSNTAIQPSTGPAEPLPKPAARPKPAPRRNVPMQNTKGNAASSKENQASSASTDVESLAQDDIMKYLQENLSTEADDVDLFS